MLDASYGCTELLWVKDYRATGGGRWFQWYTVLGKNENL
jgi:hypothetical protein